MKEAIFASLEGMALDNAKMIDENRDLHVTRILDGLDSLYGVSMTFQLLNAALCGLQQRQMESACAYYNHMAQITVILRERHGNRYRPGELAEKRNDRYTVHPTQLDADSTEAAPKVDSMPLNDTLDALETWYNDGVPHRPPSGRRG